MPLIDFIRHQMRCAKAHLIAMAVCSLLSSGVACAQALPDARTIPIDFKHILRGDINRRGELVGLHHQPSAPASMRFEGKDCELWFMYTSPGGNGDVRTARVELRDPDTDRVVLEKFSTLYPKSWTERQIEDAIREAFADASKQARVSNDGRWEGRTKSGMRIDGFLSADRKSIATAFPVYTPPRDERRR